MSDLRQAAQMALEALESYGKSAYIKHEHPKRLANGNKAAEALRAALAARQEPVALSANLSSLFEPIDGIDQNQPGYEWRKGWNAALRRVMDLAPAAQPLKVPPKMQPGLIDAVMQWTFTERAEWGRRVGLLLNERDNEWRAAHGIGGNE